MRNSEQKIPNPAVIQKNLLYVVFREVWGKLKEPANAILANMVRHHIKYSDTIWLSRI